jgi:electron transport complex protein RnfD
MMEMNTPKILRKTSPYLKRPQANVTRMMRDVTIALMPVTIFAIYKFGIAALIILLISIATMAGTEYLYYQFKDLSDGESFKLKNKSFTLYNFSAITSGLIFGLTLPDNTAWWIIVIGGSVGLFLGKLIFGGMGQNIFNPAALARLIVVVTYGTVISYDIDSSAGATALELIAQNPFSVDVISNYPLMDLFTGMAIPGSIGEVSAILLIIGGLYLALRTSFEVRIPLAFVGTVFVLALAVGLYTPGLNAIEYAMFHVLSGGLLFGAIFMATDPITSPITKPGRIAAGFMMGFITFIIRLFGAYPEGVVFSIVIMNMFVPSFDYFKWSKSQILKKRVYIFIGVVLLSIIVTLVGVYYAR